MRAAGRVRPRIGWTSCFEERDLHFAPGVADALRPWTNPAPVDDNAADPRPRQEPALRPDTVVAELDHRSRADRSSAAAIASSASVTSPTKTMKNVTSRRSPRSRTHPTPA